MTTPHTPTTSTKVGAHASEDRPSQDRSLGELVATATKDLSSLLRQEIALAKIELKREAVTAGKGAGLFGGAGFTAIFALLFLSIALAFALGKFTTLGVGFLIVGLLYLVAAAVMGLLGKKNLSKVGPPEKTVETVKDDVAWAKHPTTAPTRRTS